MSSSSRFRTSNARKTFVYYERFRREEELGFRLSHPSLVKVLKPREKSRPYIAMEYVEGDSLRAIMDRERPMASERALPIARQLCEAVAYLHERGVVHRDLKPENIIVTGQRRPADHRFGYRSRPIGASDHLGPRDDHARNARLHGARAHRRPTR